ncbi:Histone deacetylase-like amidohydrolase [Serratia marcescens]|uniref:Histone deacetylase-like amidohydrolase n=1 Tax=Serratia marcescens TaxID=615 RepID=A0A379Y1U0_SERMA|nr:Histone deacetylase-like amidohydrolase [Serratia marcescens]
MKATGRAANVNVPMLAGAGDDGYLHAMRRIIIPALEKFEPELIIVACGYDANALDPLARMQLHSDSFRAMTALVQDARRPAVRRQAGDGARRRLRRILRAVLRGWR